MDYSDTQLFIEGSWRDSGNGETLAVLNPLDGEEIGRVASATDSDLEAAVKAAEAGFTVWRDTPPVKRQAVLRAAAAELRSDVDRIARMMVMEQGKPFAEAKGETMAACDILDWFADEGTRVYGRIVPTRTDMSIRQMVVRDPVGPVAAFTPWNFPINQVVRKIAPALAAGCSVVLKAPEETPASPAAFVDALARAGLPKGVLNLVYGEPSRISDYLIAHPSIRKITFTGSTAVGKLLAAKAGSHMKRVSMELGGHAPVIICDDADMKAAVATCGAMKFRNAGQVCISPTRFLVHDSVYDQFAEGVTEIAKGLKVGSGLEDGTQMGPLANDRRVTAMQEFTEDAVSQGAELVQGGKRIGNKGNLWEPTILSNVPQNAKLFNEEPFGPVIGMRRFSELDEAVTEANRLSYGLAAYGFTRSLEKAEILSRKVEVGMMWINMPAMPSAEMPFGGIKDSGYGTEGGPEAIDCYLNLRTVAVRTH